MRFGVFVPQGCGLDLVGIDTAEQWPVMRDLALWAEGAGFESVWVYDHFHTAPKPTDEACHEAWALMAALAAATTTVRLGQMSTCIAYRNPAYLAKIAATVDIVSGGRLEMGIGAGWYEQEWRAFGYGFPRAGDRIGALQEGVEIMRQMWVDGRATLHGRYYDVDGAIGQPRPLQRPHIPLWVAGGGERRTLRIAAERAQYTNFEGTPAGFRHKSAVLEQHCRDIGRDPAEITRSANYNVVVGATEQEVRDRLARIRAMYARALPAADAESAAKALEGGPAVGTPERIVEVLRGLQADGLAYAICFFADAAHDRSGLELFAREVVPALRG